VKLRNPPALALKHRLVVNMSVTDENIVHTKWGGDRERLNRKRCSAATDCRAIVNFVAATVGRKDSFSTGTLAAATRFI
jgi:hypothetical protein